MEKETSTYTPQGGVCSKQMVILVENKIIKQVEITGGCEGNKQGISSLLIDMPVSEAIRRLEGINCKNRGTSCPDQLARALKQSGNY